MNAKDAWIATLGQFEVQLNRAAFDTWLRRAEYFAYEDGRFVVSVPNAYARDWIERHLQPDLNQALSKRFGQPVEVQLMVYTPTQPPDVETPLLRATLPAAEGENLGEAIHPAYTFDNFVCGESNRYACLVARAVAESELGLYNAIYFQGPLGVGKTHLMQAIASSLIGRGLRVIYLTAETFTTELVAAIRGNQNAAFREKFRLADAVLVDDITFVEGKDSTQAELVAIWDALRHRRRLMLFAGDRLPHELSRISRDARSRFQAGVIATIEPPDADLRRDVMDFKARTRGLNLPASVRDMLAERLTGSIRDLESAIEQLDVTTKLTGKSLDLAAAHVLRTLGASAAPNGPATGAPEGATLETVIEAAAAHFGVRADDLRGRARTRHIAAARQIAMYLAREDAGVSLPQIGEALGGRDHSTVAHGCARIAAQLTNDPTLAADIVAVRGHYLAAIPVPVRLR